jgi:type VI secretion system secreted protein VgrG
MKHALDAGMQIHLKASLTVVIEAGIQLTLKVGANLWILIRGCFYQGTMVMINSGGAAGSGPGSPTAPQDAKQASPTKPDIADDAVTGYKSCPA